MVIEWGQFKRSFFLGCETLHFMRLLILKQRTSTDNHQLEFLAIINISSSIADFSFDFGKASSGVPNNITCLFHAHKKVLIRCLLFFELAKQNIIFNLLDPNRVSFIIHETDATIS
ncbi:hypothetical protein M8C21_001999 [Ambrosia artemisiifolia]|uniref:Uncharacterized protein n=1 Tax=Ambrosia artemisiifolia TaxID=4212 RepID=A0AAD5CTV9_AMBAR|nr:hypothetical protein M8C21_001999 [Ambrosia artemisiifolia]